MNKTRTVLFVCVILLSALTLSACMSRTTPKNLIITSTLKVTRTGGKITITDVLSDTSYTFIIRHKRPPERTTERASVTKTEHIEILKCTKKIILKDLINDEFYTICIGKIFPVISVFKGGERI